MPIAVAGAIGFIVTGWGEAGLPVATTGYVYWPAFGGVIAASFILAPLGARLAHTLPVVALKKVFAVLLVGVGTKMFIG